MNKSSSMWLGVAALIIVSVGLIFFGSKNSGGVTADAGSQLASATTSLDHSKGPDDAKVTLLEYSDFECPACGAYFPVVKSLVDEYSDRVKFVYRHFPLPQHLSARVAAHAAEAAGNQGKFFEMHDMLFDDQEAWAGAKDPKAVIASYAEKLGLNMEQFTSDWNSKEVATRVESDRISGEKSGIKGTPTFYINGKQIANPQTPEAFKTLIDDALKNS